MQRNWRLAGAAAIIGIGIAAGCSATPTPPEPGQATPTPQQEATGIPALDTSRHTVPLEEIRFDTFRGDFVPLPDASEELILRLRDAIRPIYEPTYDDAANARQWMDDRDRVLGLVMGGQPYAYPVKTLVFREIVNEELDGVPLAVTYCPLCATGVVFDRRVDGRTLLFGNTSALYESDMVMFDHESGSYWHQVSGEAIAGSLSGTGLQPLPSMIATFGEWRRLHPETKVLSNSRSVAAGRGDLVPQIRDQVERGSFLVPVRNDDQRLSAGKEVLLVRLAGIWKAYPLDQHGASVINDTIGGVGVVVLRDGSTASIYRASAGGQELILTLSGDAGQGLLAHDDQTNTAWDLAGRAVSGPLQGAALEPIPARRGFWFSIAGVADGIELYGAG